MDLASSPIHCGHMLHSPSIAIGSGPKAPVARAHLVAPACLLLSIQAIMGAILISSDA
uniref:Uncharacterized protein n=1 Tax=Brassica campestris TaxID=3711 RepID=A0A3P6B8B6_BRACM|nr:unnamed protein product [Brassica rapa]